MKRKGLTSGRKTACQEWIDQLSTGIPAAGTVNTVKTVKPGKAASDMQNTARPFSSVHAAMFFMLVIILTAAGAFAEQYVMGGPKGWQDVTVRKGVTTGKGRFGYECLELDSNASQKDEYTDILINFEDDKIQDTTGKYQVVENSLYRETKAKIGKGCALSRNNGSGLILSGNGTTLFSQEGPAGSFMIDFWLCPSIVENGEVVLNWRSSRNYFGKLFYQLINLSIYQNKMKATFSNIFDGYTKNGGDVNLITNRKLIPGKWSHHTIAFTEEDGILEYRINGELECIQYMTDTGHEGGEIFPAVMGKAADLKICPHYTGLIDDFRIMRSYYAVEEETSREINMALMESHYKISGGRFESNPIMTKAGTVINKISAEVNEPAQTEVQLYVRGGDNFFNWSDTNPKWIPVGNGEEIENLSGLYFQVAADLFPDGAGEHTPSVTEITVDYSPLPDPMPPFKVTAEKGDGSVTIKWSYSVDDTVGGYYIYYGNRPGEYLGREALEGESPINAGNSTSFTLKGLNNGTIYYFAVSAYSKLDSRICGPLSKEVFARPTAK